jgi:hypothetical protein
MAAIKPTRRETLQVVLDEARRRIYAKAKALRDLAHQKDKEAKDHQTQISKLAKDVGERKHAAFLKKLAKLVKGPFPDADINLSILMEQDSNYRYYKVDGGAKLRLLVCVEEVLADLPQEQVTALNKLSADAWAECRRLGDEAHHLEVQAQRYNRSDLLSDIVLRLPDEAAPLLDELISFVAKAQEESLNQ